MLQKALRGGTNDFRTLISLISIGGSEEFIKKLTEILKDDERFSLHCASDSEDRIANLGLLVSYASHIKADVIVRINCREFTPEPQEGAHEVAQKPIVKVRAHELKEITGLCGSMASIVPFPGDEEAEVTVVVREIQKKVLDNISLDSVLMSLRDAGGEVTELNERLRELRGCMKKRTFFVSIDIFPKSMQDVDMEVKQCSELIHTLREYYLRKTVMLLDGARLLAR
ncbi:hypothetical protein H0N98_05430 [Candidatus Micrarchaeota archaeon]|nr:hypothetical protein [Candidatus Micrarchaeota archaeon]